MGAPYRISSILHGDHADIESALAGSLLPIREVAFWEPSTLPSAPEHTQPAKWEFLTKDVSEWMNTRWSWFDRLMRCGEDAYNQVMKEKPDAVLVWNDTYPEAHGACLAGRELGIPVIELVHGQTHPIRVGNQFGQSIATHRLGTRGYRDWASFHSLPGRDVSTGSSIHDMYSGVDLPSLRLVARHELAIPEHAAVVTYLTDVPYMRSAWSDDTVTAGIFVEFMKAFRALRSIVPYLHLIIKTHPYDKINEERYQGILHKLGIDTDYAVMNGPLVTALASSDIVCGPRTSAFADALSLEVPCLVLGYEPYFEERIFKGKGIAVVRDSRDVTETLTRILLEPGVISGLIKDVNAGAWYFAGAVDGNATQRTLRAIGKILEGDEDLVSCEYEMPAQSAV